MDFRRFKQVIHYGWLHAGQISDTEFGGKKKLSLFLDILKCFRKYSMWSNQYVKERFWELPPEQRDQIGTPIHQANQARNAWVKEFYRNRDFLAKWSKFDIEKSPRKRDKRTAAYVSKYNLGPGAFVEYGVIISKQHYSDGKLTVGRNVLLARNVDIDNSGDLEIQDGVAISEGAKILTHSHDVFHHKKDSDLVPFSNRAFKTNLVIKKNARIGAHAIIMPGVGEIGENSFVSAGSVVTKKVPDNVVVSGNPAQIVVKISRAVKVESRA